MVAAVVGWEDAQQKFSAHSGVGRVAGRPFQIGGVLNGQNIFVKRGGVGVFGRGRVLCAADGLGAELFGGAKSISRGLKCRGLGIRPALEFEHGKVRGIGD